MQHKWGGDYYAFPLLKLFFVKGVGGEEDSQTKKLPIKHSLLQSNRITLWTVGVLLDFWWQLHASPVVVMLTPSLRKQASGHPPMEPVKRNVVQNSGGGIKQGNCAALRSEHKLSTSSSQTVQILLLIEPVILEPRKHRTSVPSWYPSSIFWTGLVHVWTVVLALTDFTYIFFTGSSSCLFSLWFSSELPGG